METASIPSPTTDVVMRRLSIAINELERSSRHEVNAGVAAVLGSAAASVRAALTRLDADLTMLDVRAQRRAVSQPDLSPLTVGQLHIDRFSRTVTLGDQLIRLCTKEYELLCVLATEPQRVFTKDELHQLVWGEQLRTVVTRTVDSHLSRLRLKLGGVPWVTNRFGVGYSLLPAPATLAELPAGAR